MPWLPVFFLYFIERVPLGEAVLLAVQVLLTAGIAFQSGSDSALLYDSLHSPGREQEYTERETIAQKWSMTALACSCLVGGRFGVVDLQLT